MAITFWRNVQRKITTQEMDASFDTLVNDIANAGLSAEMPEGQIYIGDNTNTASLETLDTSIVPEATDKNYVSDAESVVIANTSGTNTGDNATNTTSNAYADAKVADAINDGTTTIAPSQNAVFDALALKEDLITKNATNTPLVWTSANGVASFQPLPVLGDLTYYLTNTASDVATYYKQTTTPQVSLTSLPFASVTNGQLLATFISEPNNPNRLSIPDGQYLNHLHLGKTGGTKDLQVRAEIWETTSAGVDIVKLADLGPSTLITGSGSTEYIIGYNTVEKTLSSVTSRIVTKIYSVVSGGGSAPSISIFQGDGSDSRSNLPAPVVDASNYVPYTGALNDVDLGSKKITATDVIVSGATASTIAHFDATKNIESLPTATYPNLTELSYVKGVTSAIQTQLNNKLAGSGLTTNYATKYNGTNIVNSLIFDNGTNVGISTATPNSFSILDLSNSNLVFRLPYNATSTASQMGAGAMYWNPSGFINFSDGGTIYKVGNVYFNPSSNVTVLPSGGGLQYANYATANGTRNFAYAGSSTVYTGDDFSMRWGGIVSNGNMKFKEGIDIGSTGAPWMNIFSAYGAFRFRCAKTNVGGITNYVEGVIYVNGATINAIEIVKPSSDTSTLNVTLVSNRVYVTGTSVEYIIEPLVSKLDGASSSALSNQTYSADGATTFWKASGGLGIGHTSQNANAILQADSTIKGMLPPRMTTTQSNAIATTEGNLTVDTILHRLKFDNGTTKKTIAFTDDVTATSVYEPLRFAPLTALVATVVAYKIIGTGTLPSTSTSGTTTTYANVDAFMINQASTMYKIGIRLTQACTDQSTVGSNPTARIDVYKSTSTSRTLIGTYRVAVTVTAGIGTFSTPGTLTTGVDQTFELTGLTDALSNGDLIGCEFVSESGTTKLSGVTNLQITITTKIS